MKYRRVVNRRLDDAAASVSDDDLDPALVARCWPELEEETLPRVVQRSGHAVLDEGWEVVDDDQDDAKAQPDDAG